MEIRNSSRKEFWFYFDNAFKIHRLSTNLKAWEFQTFLSLKGNTVRYSLTTVQKDSNDPPQKIQRTRTIKGYFFNEDLRPNQQLDVLG